MIATGFVAAGVKTYISSRKIDVCDATALRLSKSGECISIPADLSSLDGVNYLVDEMRKREGKLDILDAASESGLMPSKRCCLAISIKR